MRFAYSILTVLFCWFELNGQNYTINGYIEDARTGERLIGATIYDSVSLNGSNSNSYGYFNLKCNKGSVSLIYSYIGYKTSRISFFLASDTTINIVLEPITYKLSEVIVNDNRHLTESTDISTIVLPISFTKQIPVLMSEADVLKILQLIPGVQSGTEGTSGLYIRGGSPDQNLILLDGVPVYNPDHLFGFISIFNPDAIKNVTLITGGFPSRYGGRLSSVVDIRMKEGNNKEFHGDATIGLISSKITIEGPLKKDKTSYLVSARRSWVDIITRSFLKKKEYPYYYFYDLTAKINHIFSNQNTLYFSIYAGKDNISGIDTKSEFISSGVEYLSEEKQNYGWGNITAALRWNYIFNKNLFSNTSLTYSNYQYFDNKLFNNTQTEQSTGSLNSDKYKSDFNSGIRNIALKVDFDYQPLTGHTFKFGVEAIYHQFTPFAHISLINSSPDITLTSSEQYKQNAFEPSFYVEDEIQVINKLKINTGLRISSFLVKNKTYSSFEPRFSGSVLISDNCALKLSYSRMKQYIHLLTSSRITFPTDLWVPATDKVNPQISDQISLGAVYNFAEDYEFRIETYYKSMKDLIEYSEGSSFLDTGNWETKIEKGGLGRAYGLEFMLKKSSGKTTGWLSYTLAKTERQFENISLGRWFPYKYDRRHDVNVLVSRKINDKLDVGLTWEFSSGNLYTIITDVYDSYLVGGDFKKIQYYESRNNYRLPSYHRLDLGINFHKQKKIFYRTWSVSVYNAYNHKNVFFVYYGNDDIHGRKDLIIFKKYTLFPILPSVTYSLKF